ncbi:MAG: site-specific integrase [Pseudomonadota bacterium]
MTRGKRSPNAWKMSFTLTFAAPGPSSRPTRSAQPPARFNSCRPDTLSAPFPNHAVHCRSCGVVKDYAQRRTQPTSLDNPDHDATRFALRARDCQQPRWGAVSYETAYSIIRRACLRAGLRRIGWHTLRHTFASQLVTDGVPMRVVQDLLGHSTVQMTLRYALLAPSTLLDAVAVLEAADSALGNPWASRLRAGWGRQAGQAG